MLDSLIGQQLKEARIALHKLVTGTGVVELEVEGQRTRFTPANREDLEAYIARLDALVSGAPSRGAIGFIF